MLILYDPRSAEYGSSARPEQPARVLTAVPFLKERHPDWTWRIPEGPVPDEVLRQVHTAAHLRRLEQPRDFDPDTPYFPAIADHARRSVAGAWEAMRHAWAHRTPVFSLLRPPGHHASAGTAAGFCYLNQVAIAAMAAQREPGVERVAIWDFDAHHGNGTEAVVQGQKDILFCSVHQWPGYPGTGGQDLGNCRNWPVPPGASRTTHLTALRKSWETVLAFRPDLILVSAGFDAYAQDPLTQLSLEAEDFGTLGDWLRESGRPAAAVLEGGYSENLPRLIDSFLSAWDGE
jgi:acetoin utilization deacetylase AcuC-like enzyme